MNLGVDLGGTNVRAGLVDRSGRVRARALRPTDAHRGAEAVVETIADLCRRAAGDRWNQVVACGVGTPGILDVERTRVEFSPNLPGWHEVPLRRLLEIRLRKRVVLENDANCAAYGEYLSRRTRRPRCLVFFTLGTGVGGGIVMDGNLWTGARGGAAELGHMMIHARGRPCSCGRRGCLEAYASATAVAKRYRMLTGKQRTAREVFLAGDAAARRTLQEAVEALANAVTSLAHALQPDLVVLGGGLARAGPRLLQPLRREVRRLAFASHWKALRIVRSSLGGDAGIVGAAALSDGSHEH